MLAAHLANWQHSHIATSGSRPKKKKTTDRCRFNLPFSPPPPRIVCNALWHIRKVRNFHHSILCTNTGRHWICLQFSVGVEPMYYPKRSEYMATIRVFRMRRLWQRVADRVDPPCGTYSEKWLGHVEVYGVQLWGLLWLRFIRKVNVWLWKYRDGFDRHNLVITECALRIWWSEIYVESLFTNVLRLNSVYCVTMLTTYWIYGFSQYGNVNIWKRKT